MTPRPDFSLPVAGRRTLLGHRTLIMGVLNVTLDSFSDGGRYLDPQRAVKHALDLVRQGADWIDVGGESTRPGSAPVSLADELRRVIPVVRELRLKKPLLPISIDTTKPEVAEKALCAGATILNDVSGLRFDRSMADVARLYKAPLVLMHLRGRPADMQKKPFARHVWRSVMRGLCWSVRKALKAGLTRSQLIVDPGLGFGKTRRQNFEIIAGMRRLHRLRCPVLAGTSRKSFVQAVAAGDGLNPRPTRPLRQIPYWRITRGGTQSFRHGPPESERLLLLGDASALTASILAGAHIVRVHDVAAALPVVRIADAVLASVSNY